jgi:anti-sigma factor RsiW
MWCSAPPPLTDDQLSAVIDGVSDRSVQEHLDQCSGCAARLAHARQVEQMLTTQLRRWDCPTPQQLGNYHLGMAEQAEDRRIVRHLESCAACMAEVEELRRFLSDEVEAPQAAPRAVPAPRPSRPRLGELVARLLPQAPAMALRGAASGPIVAEVDGITLILDVQSSSEGKVDVVGQIASDDQDAWTGALVEVRAEGTLVALAEVDDLGGFTCISLPASPVDLRATTPGGKTVVLPSVDLAG